MPPFQPLRFNWSAKPKVVLSKRRCEYPPKTSIEGSLEVFCAKPSWQKDERTKIRTAAFFWTGKTRRIAISFGLNVLKFGNKYYSSPGWHDSKSYPSPHKVISL